MSVGGKEITFMDMVSIASIKKTPSRVNSGQTSSTHMKKWSQNAAVTSRSIILSSQQP